MKADFATQISVVVPVTEVGQIESQLMNYMAAVDRQSENSFAGLHNAGVARNGRLPCERKGLHHGTPKVLLTLVKAYVT